MRAWVTYFVAQQRMWANSVSRRGPTLSSRGGRRSIARPQCLSVTAVTADGRFGSHRLLQLTQLMYGDSLQGLELLQLPRVPLARPWGHVHATCVGFLVDFLVGSFVGFLVLRSHRRKGFLVAMSTHRAHTRILTPMPTTETCWRWQDELDSVKSSAASTHCRLQRVFWGLVNWPAATLASEM